jgi:hypothetical protein
MIGRDNLLLYVPNIHSVAGFVVVGVDGCHDLNGIFDAHARGRFPLSQGAKVFFLGCC